MGEILTTVKLTKTFGKQITAVKEADLSLDRGQFVILSGEEGAGKTTFLNLLTGALVPDMGEVCRKTEDSRVICIPDPPVFYNNLTACRNLEILRRTWGRTEADLYRLLEMTGLANWAHVRVRSFSRPMLKRLAMSVVLLKDPELILFDEPFKDADEETRAVMARIFRSMKETGKTVLATCRNPSELADFADVFVSISKGVLSTSSEREAIYSELQIGLRITAEPLVKVRELLNSMGIYGYKTLDINSLLLMERLRDSEKVLETLRSEGVRILDCRPVFDSPDSLK